MEPIRNFDQLTEHLKTLNRRKRIAVVCANDPNTEYAIARALDEGIAEFLMIGDSAILQKYPTLQKYPDYVKTIHIEDPDEAAREAVRIVREGGADILMKGIINTSACPLIGDTIPLISPLACSQEVRTSNGPSIITLPNSPASANSTILT